MRDNVDNLIIGGLGIKPDKDGNTEREWVNGFAVNPLYRNQGLGTALLNKVLENVMPTTKSLRLITIDRLKSAIRLYEAAGFKTYDQTWFHFC